MRILSNILPISWLYSWFYPQNEDSKIKSTKNLIIFPGGFYTFGSRSWSRLDNNWIYFFPNLEGGYLVNGMPTLDEKLNIEYYSDFCPGSEWQPDFLSNEKDKIFSGPVILTKKDNNWSSDYFCFLKEKQA